MDAPAVTTPNYTAIRVNTLRGDLKIPFDVYVKVGSKFIHYCRSGTSFEGTRLARLKAKKLRKLFIKPEDEVPYKQYLEQNIDEAYANKDKSIEVRAEVIQGFQEAEAEAYMEEPTNQTTYEHIRSSMQRFVEFLMTEPEAAGALLKMENTDLSLTHHCVNVATLTTAMVMDLKLKESAQMELIALGCMVHDIDHFYTPKDLSKPRGQMTKEELAIYKAHPIKGAERLQGATFIDQMVFNIIIQHEEYMDGSGFPKGLYEKDIDPVVMVAATANAYDHLVGFEKKPPKEAIKYMLVEYMGLYPLPYLQSLQRVLKGLSIL